MTQSEIDQVIDTALTEYFAKRLGELTISASSDLGQSMMVNMLMELIDKVDSLEKTGISIASSPQSQSQVQPPKVEEKPILLIKEEELGSVGKEDEDDFLLDILK